jgi:hypothetical protein
MNRRRRRIASMLCASIVLVGAIWSVNLLGATSRPHVVAARPHPAPAYVTRGKQLVNQFFEMLRPGDHHAALEAFLASWFQRQGETIYAQKGAYIAHPPVVTKWSLTRFHITHGPQTLVVDFWVKASEIVNGVQLNDAAYSPRLAVFQYVRGHWQLSAYASFNPPA